MENMTKGSRAESAGVAAALFAVVLITGMSSMAASRPATAAQRREGAPPSAWPWASALPRAAGRPALVLFTKPGSPCRDANLEDFKQALRVAGGQATASIVYDRPAGPELKARSAAGGCSWNVPGAWSVTDAGGAEAALFSARSVGQVLVYDAQGKLQFSGGVSGPGGRTGVSLSEETR